MAVSIAPLKSGAVIRLDHAVMYLYFMKDRIVRMRVCFEEKEEASYILQAVSWEDRLDGLFEGERLHLMPLEVQSEETETDIIFSTKTLRLFIKKRAPGNHSFHTPKGDIFCPRLRFFAGGAAK